jgi:hypothetical protein
MKRLMWFVPIGFLALATVACIGTSSSGFDLRGTYELNSGDQRDGSQFFMARNLKLNTGSEIDGDATLIGNDVTLDSIIDGDVVVIADTLTVGDTALIQGNLTLCVNSFDQSETAQITGEIKRECKDANPVSASDLFQSGADTWREGFLLRLGVVFTGALFLGAFAALSSVLIPQQLDRMSSSIRQVPLAIGGVGCLTFIVAGIITAIYTLSLLLVFPVILLPFFVVGWLLIGVGALLGWTALAAPLGNRLLRLLRMSANPSMVTAVVGGFVLSLLAGIWIIFWSTQWVGVFALAVVGSLGLGSAVLTRIGTRSYPVPPAPEAEQS